MSRVREMSRIEKIIGHSTTIDIDAQIPKHYCGPEIVGAYDIRKKVEFLAGIRLQWVLCPAVQPSGHMSESSGM